MISRPDYLEKLKPFIDVKVIKILAGIRRCGKSTILEMLKQELISNGVKEDHIISINYSNVEFDKSFNYVKMYDELKAKFVDVKKYYMLLDELQEVDGWEKTVNSLFEEKNVDIYVTGSNSKLLSSEISTYLTGRYVTISVYTLSFKEYLTFKNNQNKPIKEQLQDYIRFGGFPLVAISNLDEKTSYQIVEDIYNSVVVNDITKKHNIQNIDLFNRVVRFIVENIGKTFSANSIVKFLKSENRTISVETIYNYLQWLEKAFYIADQSIKYALFGFNPTTIASMMENLVYFELKRRGYDVFIGKNVDKEIDFVAIDRDKKLYIQVCRELPKESDREFANLIEIKDNYPKMIVTLDDYASGNVNGINVVHLADFLLNNY